MGKKTTAPDPVLPDDQLAEGTQLLESGSAAMLVERAEVIVPKKGKLFEERVIEGGHTVNVAKFAIIRPCQSKGKAIRGFQPIYEARMLAENAPVFSGWQMYIDHVAREVAEAFEAFLQEKGRSSKELGGRVLRTWWDTDLVMEADEQNGHQKGGVVGEVIPYTFSRQMLEDDPLSLAVSINAWPTSAVIGRPSWDSTKKGAVIEGIRKVPQGSVDFVPRAGAGGRILTEHASPEEVRSAVSLLESAYAAARADDPHDPRSAPVKKKLSEMSAEEIGKLSATELQEALSEENPSLAESLTTEPAPSNGGGNDGMITEEQLDKKLTEQREALVEEFGTSREAAEELAEDIVAEREELRGLERHAAKKLAEAKENGLPKEYVEEVAKGYVVTSRGATPNLIIREEDLQTAEGETLTPNEVVESRLRADIATSVKLIEAAGGRAPRIEGLAPSGKADPTGEKKPEQRKRLREGGAWGEFLRESGDLTGDAEKDDKRVREMVEG